MWNKCFKGNAMNAIIVAIIAAVVGLTSYFVTKNPDNVVEQAAESVIDAELGLPPGTIDLTPEKKPD